MRDLHSALRTDIVKDVSEIDLHLKHVRLQYGRNDFVDTLHVRPSSWTSSGLQSTDLLNFMGFRRSRCAFHSSECYVSEIPSSLDMVDFARSFGTALGYLQSGTIKLEECGLDVPQPEGWGFFQGTPSLGRQSKKGKKHRNGHVAPKVERLKNSEDDYFNFVLTWIEGDGAKGWTTHYRPKHMPISSEFASALRFVGGFSEYNECPEFDFEKCFWRFTEFKQEGSGHFGKNTNYVHRCFDAHATHFSPGLKELLAAHVEIKKIGFSFLNTVSNGHSIISERESSVQRMEYNHGVADFGKFDVAISFAGTERKYAEQLAKLVRSAGFKVFYDSFYPEQLWGKDLVAFFDRVYRKASRYCVMFISAEYANRIWSTHERRSAQARALEEKGHDYILPVRVDDTDIDGLPPTVGYLSLDQFSISKIADILVKKLHQ